MSTVLKRFSSLDELSSINEEQYNRFSCLSHLNTAIENECKSWEWIKESYQRVYLDILADEWEESDYREFHYHIKYAMNEMKESDNRNIPVNRVREFIEAKLPNYKESTKFLLEESEFLADEERDTLVKYLMSGKKAYITLVISGFSPFGLNYDEEFAFDTTLSQRDLYGCVKDLVESLESKVLKEQYILSTEIKSIEAL
jgi:hypothetical protein